jgi:hypothetical protein
MNRTTSLLAVALIALSGAAFAQSPSYTTPDRQPGTPNNPSAMAPAAPANPAGMAKSMGTATTPSRTESADTAFRTLDPANRGYLSQGDVARLPGFTTFEQADTNKDGRLGSDEFSKAWSTYESPK